MGFWLLTRYEDVAAAIRDELFSHESFWDEPVSHHDASDQRQAHVVNSFSQMLMYRDGGVHARMRRQAKHTFAPKQIKRSREGVERICRALLEGCREQAEPSTTPRFRDAAAQLGHRRLHGDSDGRPRGDPGGWWTVSRSSSEPLLPEEDRRAMLIDTVALCDYLDELIVARRKTRKTTSSRCWSTLTSEGKMSVDEIRGNLHALPHRRQRDDDQLATTPHRCAVRAPRRPRTHLG